MDEIDEQLATLQYLKKFEDEVQSLIERLRARYKNRPTDPARIVSSVVTTICARLIVGTSPLIFWDRMLHGLAVAIKKEELREKGGKNDNNSK